MRNWETIGATAAAAVMVLTVSTADAAVISYDAGLSPATPTSPADQGWTALGINPGNGATGTGVVDDLGTGLNAWNITDGSTADRPRYEYQLPGAAISDMATHGWTLTFVARGIGTSANIAWGVDDDTAFGGTGVGRRWGAGMSIDNAGNLFVQWYGGSQQQVTLNGTGADAYHEVRLVGEAGSTNATLFIDGFEMGTNAGQANGGTPNKIEFGGVSTGGTGSQANWHSIELAAVPEPASLTLLAAASLGAFARRGRR